MPAGRIVSVGSPIVARLVIEFARERCAFVG
jgi:hypothetical protein